MAHLIMGKYLAESSPPAQVYGILLCFSRHLCLHRNALIGACKQGCMVCWMVTQPCLPDIASWGLEMFQQCSSSFINHAVANMLQSVQALISVLERAASAVLCTRAAGRSMPAWPSGGDAQRLR